MENKYFSLLISVFYLSEINTYIEKRNFYHEQTLGYIMPKYKSFEIDDEIDFDIVEMLMKKYNYL